jgi:threonine dehydrogenase-like Zn-dependent dehydrogenase
MMIFSIILTLALMSVSHGFAPTAFSSKSKLPLNLKAKTSEKQKEIKVGVIGCGRIGIVHLGAISKCPNVTPVIVSNPTVSKAEAGQ